MAFTARYIGTCHLYGDLADHLNAALNQATAMEESLKALDQQYLKDLFDEDMIRFRASEGVCSGGFSARAFNCVGRGRPGLWRAPWEEFAPEMALKARSWARRFRLHFCRGSAFLEARPLLATVGQNRSASSATSERETRMLAQKTSFQRHASGAFPKGPLHRTSSCDLLPDAEVGPGRSTVTDLGSGAPVAPSDRGPPRSR